MFRYNLPVAFVGGISGWGIYHPPGIRSGAPSCAVRRIKSVDDIGGGAFITIAEESLVIGFDAPFVQIILPNGILRVYIGIISVPYSLRGTLHCPIIPAAIGIISSIYPHLEIPLPHHFVVGIHIWTVECENPIAQGVPLGDRFASHHIPETIAYCIQSEFCRSCEPFMEVFGHIVVCPEKM